MTKLPTAGSIKLGHNVAAEYFAQDQYKVLDPEARMLDDISRAALRVPEVALRSLLGCFLFSGDDVFKPLGVLSGGERNRYALARILVSPSNFLLLDEPTNHLDMRAKDVLLEAISGYSGTVVFVSHDRYFIDRLATRVLEIDSGAITAYEGNYEDYLRRKEGWRRERLGTETKNIAAEPNSSPRRKAAPARITLLIEGGYDETERSRASPQPYPPPEPHQAEAMKVAARFSKKRSRAWKPPRAHRGTTRVYVSAAETQRLTTLARSSARNWPRSLPSGKN